MLGGGNARRAERAGKPCEHPAQPLHRRFVLRVPAAQPLRPPLPPPSASITGEVTPPRTCRAQGVAGDTNAPLCLPQTYVVSWLRASVMELQPTGEFPLFLTPTPRNAMNTSIQNTWIFFLDYYIQVYIQYLSGCQSLQRRGMSGLG